MRKTGLLLAVVTVLGPAASGQDKTCTQWAQEARDPEKRIDVLSDMSQINSTSAFCAELVPMAVKSLEDEEAAIRNYAATALFRSASLSTEPVMPQLAAIAAAKQRLAATAADDAVDMMAAMTLHKVLGELGADAVPHLTSDLRHAHWEMRASAAAELQGMGAAAASALRELQAALKAEKNEEVRTQFQMAIQAVSTKE